jgi:polyphosphate kinase 2
VKKEHKIILHKLHIELVKLQNEIISSGLKLLVIIEGRDAAGKDSMVKRIIKHLSPRETRVVALPKPSDRETNEWYFQRYSKHLPASGEFVIFNRSWYNRAGVEKVMKFCTQEEYEKFFKDVELYEKILVNSGIIIVKYYLDISKKEQAKRLEDRKEDPLKQWKISAIDGVAQKLWNDYSVARKKMLEQTDFKHSPWYIADAENKNQVHVALIAHLLQHLDYKKKDHELLDKAYGLIYSITPENVKTKLYD